MPKKIYDIKPPRVAKKAIVRKSEENEVKEFLAQDKIFISHTAVKKQRNRKKEKSSIWRPVSITIFAVIIIIGVYLFFTLPKADITIWPKVDTLSFQQTITANKLADSVDAIKSVIPAQYFEVSKTVSQDFPATGSAADGGTASGTITIYNKYDPATPFSFKSGTHFMSDSGKLFIANQKIVIPAATKSGSKITPGSVQIKIQAVEPGESYNIAPSNFSIPGLKGAPYYYSIYAVSTTAMAGGFTGKTKKVTDDDIQGAKEVLVKKATDDATTALKNQISSDYILSDNAITSITTDVSTKTKSGTAIDNFNYQATVKVSALTFKKTDLDQFAKQYIISQMPDGKTLLDNSFKISYSASTVDVSGGKATVNLNFSSAVYQDIDKNSVSISLLGKDAGQINETINNILGNNVSNVKINFWPFWVRKAPTSQKAVNVELKFE